METSALYLDEIAVRCQWVIDKVWVTVRVRTTDGHFHELRPQAMEWPVEPRTRKEWLDIVAEATNLPLETLQVR